MISSYLLMGRHHADPANESKARVIPRKQEWREDHPFALEETPPGEEGEAAWGPGASARPASPSFTGDKGYYPYGAQGVGSADP